MQRNTKDEEEQKKRRKRSHVEIASYKERVMRFKFVGVVYRVRFELYVMEE